MSITQCMNCGSPVDFDDLIVTHKRKIVGAVCTKCVEGVRKPRVTLTRDSRGSDFVAEQYSAVEIFR